MLSRVLVGVVMGAMLAGAGSPPVTDELDPRIDRSKVTESPAVPTAADVAKPGRPVFRIAVDASEVPVDAAVHTRAMASLDHGIDYLLGHQAKDGSWMRMARAESSEDESLTSPVTIAVTALVVRALAQVEPTEMRTAALGKGVLFLRRAQQEDGSFVGGDLTNYVTSAVVSALSAFDRDEYAGEIQDAVVWLKENQWDDGEGLNVRQDWYGGAGYGNRARPDVSNTQMMLDALYDAGVSPDEPAVQRALAFLTRAQNLKATNGSAWSGDDGGFVYTPANGGESFASEVAGEGRYGELIPAGTPRSLRSYGSMTYAGFKSMIYAGLTPDDVRVQAALDWIRSHWTFDENPGLGEQGLFYYYHTMARALRAAGVSEISDDEGVAHNWRAELIDALGTRQRADGSWVNEADRWMEGQPVMATVDAVLALEEALKGGS